MKKLFLKFSVLFLALVCALGLVACGKKEEDSRRYEGTYKAYSVALNALGTDYTLTLGGNSIFGKLTEDLAVLTLKEDGSFSFDVDVLKLVKFNVTGTWSPDETDEGKINTVINGEKILADCDGQTLIITYEGATYTLKKA